MDPRLSHVDLHSSNSHSHVVPRQTWAASGEIGRGDAEQKLGFQSSSVALQYLNMAMEDHLYMIFPVRNLHS